MFRRLLALTIWRPGIFDPANRYAGLYRVVLPLFDVTVIVAGVGAILYGAPAFTDFSDGVRVFGLIWGIWTTAFGLTALVGIVFPRLLKLEGVGKSGIVASAIVYEVILATLTLEGDTARLVAAAMSVAAVLISVWRLFDLRYERLQRDARKHEGEKQQ